MKEDYRFLNELSRIVNGALRLDVDKVRNYTAFLADKLEGSGEKVAANRLRKMLEESDGQLRPANAKFAATIPVDSESRFPLVERINLKASSNMPLMLEQAQWDIVNEFVSVSKSYAQVDALGLANSLTLLLYGPPGTGKSHLARWIAQELRLDLYVARLDGLISSFLGSTSKNIRALFDFAAKTPCILFLDEFDAIAKLRGDSQELGELKRVVNSFIQNLDSLGSQSIVIAATNHQELLDSAIWRRFSYRLEFRFPTEDIREQMWESYLKPMKFDDKEINMLVDLTEGFSGSDIQEICKRLRRKQIISKKLPEFKEAFQILQNMAGGEGENRRFLTKLHNKNEHEVLALLRERNEKLYSFANLGDLLGVSKATVHRMAKEGK